jgi:hypothetical protein
MAQTARITIEARRQRISFVDRDELSVAQEREADCQWQDAWASRQPALPIDFRFTNPGELAERYYVQTIQPKTIFSSLICDYPIDSLDWKEFKISLERHLTNLGYPDIHLALPVNKTDTSTEGEFKALAAQWRKETGMMSMLHKKSMHPAYQRIIGMGKDALPFIFRELNERGGHWLWALCAITGEDAAKPEHNLKQAVEAWLQWGREHGYL